MAEMLSEREINRMFADSWPGGNLNPEQFARAIEAAVLAKAAAPSAVVEAPPVAWCLKTSRGVYHSPMFDNGRATQQMAARLRQTATPLYTAPPAAARLREALAAVERERDQLKALLDECQGNQGWLAESATTGSTDGAE